MTEKHTALPVLSQKKMGMVINPPVFIITGLLSIGFIVFTLINVESAAGVFNNVKKWMSVYFGWFLIAGTNTFLVYSLWLLFSKYSKIRIGGKDAKPEFTLWGWLSMLFSAGTGIGIIFWGVSEPMYHFSGPPAIGAVTEPLTTQAAELAMGITFFHWSLHAWGIYTVLALALAFFAYNRKLPMTIRYVFQPLLGDKVNGPVGHFIDILAVLATLFGVATSCGLGVQQINAGLEYVMGIPNSITVQIILIAVITAIAIWSVMTGLEGGIKRLSQINVIICLGLMLFVFFAGPTLFLLESLIENLGTYIQKIIPLSFATDGYVPQTWQGEDTWTHWWTLFYWAWWIAWAPFVSTFIARISKGRTIGEFILGVLLVPCLLTFCWMTVFGGSALFIELAGDGGILDATKNNVATAIYALLDNFPLPALVSVLAMISISTFFVTSADSAALVMDFIASGGYTEAPKIQRSYWAIIQGAVGAVLLLGGGLTALQTGSVVTGLPFCAIMLLMLISLSKGLRQEYNAYYQ